MSRGRTVLVAALVASATGLGVAVPAAADRPDLSVKTLIAATSQYVARYEQAFAFLLADEAYVQTRLRSNTAVESRALQSEMFLTFLPADHEWVAVRDVLTVDGVPVPSRDDLRTLLATRAELRGLIAQVVARNARYNIGVTRNFNEPTLPLLLVEAGRVTGVKFERGPVIQDGDATLATLSFAEPSSPTLVRGPQGPMPATGEIVVEAGTGVVRRTRFDLHRSGYNVRLTTEYARDSKIGLWLPAIFTERYETAANHELVLGNATYTNYRRFEVNARIK